VRYRLDLSGRRVSDEREVLNVREQSGFPDGMVAAAADSVIIAFYNPEPVSHGRAVRFDLRTGKGIEEWTTPGSPRVTCPLLVERDGRARLILTTATEGMPSEMREACPNAGNLFWAETSIATLPPSEFVRLAN
jgi:sugar lactone lactonase YvrE